MDNTTFQAWLSATEGLTASQRDEVLGVLSGTAEKRHIGYLTEPQPASDEVLGLAGPVKPTEVFRIAAPCAESACAHFDGARCRLAQRIVQNLPVASAGLPPCKIRVHCRWWQQEGKAACLQCPEVITDTYNVYSLIPDLTGGG